MQIHQASETLHQAGYIHGLNREPCVVQPGLILVIFKKYGRQFAMRNVNKYVKYSWDKTPTRTRTNEHIVQSTRGYIYEVYSCRRVGCANPLPRGGVQLFRKNKLLVMGSLFPSEVPTNQPTNQPTNPFAPLRFPAITLPQHAKLKTPLAFRS